MIKEDPKIQRWVPIIHCSVSRKEHFRPASEQREP